MGTNVYIKHNKYFSAQILTIKPKEDSSSNPPKTRKATQDLAPWSTDPLLSYFSIAPTDSTVTPRPDALIIYRLKQIFAKILVPRLEDEAHNLTNYFIFRSKALLGPPMYRFT